ncbi:hypothetical protein [Vibrio campbellii]|uniref:hypothetical protein n=1 Tax=Vibrio campbellii TaxID=680 RepID=UPI0038CD548C
MINFLKGVVIYIVGILAVLLVLRASFDYFSAISLVDFIAYSGVFLVVLAGITFDRSSPADSGFLSLMVHRELVSRSEDSEYENKASFSISVGLVGMVLLIASGVLAWLGGK